LERLISDPAFRNALAADPARALAGYRLSPDELELLNAQVDTGTGGQRHVEQRTSKASLFGLLSPMGGSGLTSDPVDTLHGGGGDSTQVLGSAGGHTAAAPAYSSGAEPQEGFGPAVHEGFGSAEYQPEGGELGQAFGSATSADSAYPDPGAGPRAESQGLGRAFGAATTGDPDVPQQSHGTIYGSAAASNVGGTDQLSPGRGGPPADYHTRVDADGDGRWDRFTAVDRGDRGVDLVVDRDNDGRPEFVGHDVDRDGLIDSADTDDDHDGRLDSRWVDDNGDGWLDRREDLPAADAPPPAEGQRGPERS
jgi:hypothetical protein